MMHHDQVLFQAGFHRESFGANGASCLAGVGFHVIFKAVVAGVRRLTDGTHEPRRLCIFRFLLFQVCSDMKT